MFRLFTRDFFKFSFGFIAMLTLGLLGIVLTGYFGSEASVDQTASQNVQNTRGISGADPSQD